MASSKTEIERGGPLSRMALKCAMGITSRQRLEEHTT